MADFAKSIPRVIKAQHEAELEEKIFKLQMTTQQYVDVITVYPKGSFIYAWIRIDARNVAALPSVEKEPIIKKQTKKRTKKA